VLGNARDVLGRLGRKAPTAVKVFQPEEGVIISVQASAPTPPTSSPR